MFSAEAGQMSAVETGQMSAAETGQMSAAETRQMYSIKTGQRPVAILNISLVSTADLCPVSAEDATKGPSEAARWVILVGTQIISTPRV